MGDTSTRDSPSAGRLRIVIPKSARLASQSPQKPAHLPSSSESSGRSIVVDGPGLSAHNVSPVFANLPLDEGGCVTVHKAVRKCTQSAYQNFENLLDLMPSLDGLERRRSLLQFTIRHRELFSKLATVLGYVEKHGNDINLARSAIWAFKEHDGKLVEIADALAHRHGQLGSASLPKFETKMAADLLIHCDFQDMPHAVAESVRPALLLSPEDRERWTGKLDQLLKVKLCSASIPAKVRVILVEAGKAIISFFDEYYANVTLVPCGQPGRPDDPAWFVLSIKAIPEVAAVQIGNMLTFAIQPKFNYTPCSDRGYFQRLATSLRQLTNVFFLSTLYRQFLDAKDRFRIDMRIEFDASKKLMAVLWPKSRHAQTLEIGIDQRDGQTRFFGSSDCSIQAKLDMDENLATSIISARHVETATGMIDRIYQQLVEAIDHWPFHKETTIEKSRGRLELQLLPSICLLVSVSLSTLHFVVGGSPQLDSKTCGYLMQDLNSSSDPMEFSTRLSRYRCKLVLHAIDQQLASSFECSVRLPVTPQVQSSFAVDTLFVKPMEGSEVYLAIQVFPALRHLQIELAALEGAARPGSPFLNISRRQTVLRSEAPLHAVLSLVQHVVGNDLAHFLIQWRLEELDIEWNRTEDGHYDLLDLRLCSAISSVTMASDMKTLKIEIHLDYPKIPEHLLEENGSIVKTLFISELPLSQAVNHLVPAARASCRLLYLLQQDLGPLFARKHATSNHVVMQGNLRGYYAEKIHFRIADGQLEYGPDGHTGRFRRLSDSTSVYNCALHSFPFVFLRHWLSNIENIRFIPREQNVLVVTNIRGLPKMKFLLKVPAQRRFVLLQPEFALQDEHSCQIIRAHMSRFAKSHVARECEPEVSMISVNPDCSIHYSGIAFGEEGILVRPRWIFMFFKELGCFANDARQFFYIAENVSRLPIKSIDTDLKRLSVIFEASGIPKISIICSEDGTWHIQSSAMKPFIELMNSLISGEWNVAAVVSVASIFTCPGAVLADFVRLFALSKRQLMDPTRLPIKLELPLAAAEEGWRPLIVLSSQASVKLRLVVSSIADARKVQISLVYFWQQRNIVVEAVNSPSSSAADSQEDPFAIFTASSPSRTLRSPRPARASLTLAEQRGLTAKQLVENAVISASETRSANESLLYSTVEKLLRIPYDELAAAFS